jgi:IS5 family transposase
VLEMASEMKLLKLGTVCLDGTKIHANASRHSALSHGHIEKLEAQLKSEVQELLALAEQADKADVPDGMNLPEELKRREDRLALMAVAKAKIGARAQERYARERAEYDEKMTRRAAKEAASARKSGGKAPVAPEAGPRDKDQINLTDEESRIMPVSGGGFEQAYNAQAGVDAATMLVVATGVTQATNDKQQVEPMLETLAAQTATQGQVKCLIADTGYFSEHNMKACEGAKVEPLIAVARENHHPSWRERHTEPAPLPATATPTETMAHRLKTKDGCTRYALRKQTVEPVFGIIKSVMGFRQFSLRGLEKVRGEWSLVCLAWNLKRMAVLRPKFG